jgi:hypothetical protein
MKLPFLSILLILVPLALSKESTFPGDEKVLAHLAKKLSHQECWVVGNYLAQKSPKPSHAQEKMAKIGGHAKDYDCSAALNFWASTILPLSLEKVQQKELYVSPQLP